MVLITESLNLVETAVEGKLSSRADVIKASRRLSQNH